MTHYIKIEKSFADAVLCGDKTFEIRRNDRGYQKGDCIQFIPMDGLLCKDVFHPLKDKVYTITYVMNGYGLENGYVVFGIKELKEEVHLGCELRREEQCGLD